MFEYLSTGIPILSSNLPVLREVLIDKHNCLIVKNNNLNEWKKNINIIDKNFMLRKKIKKNAIKTAKKYSWDSRAEKYLKEYLKFKNLLKFNFLFQPKEMTNKKTEEIIFLKIFQLNKEKIIYF